MVLGWKDGWRVDPLMDGGWMVDHTLITPVMSLLAVYVDRPSPCKPNCTLRALVAHASLHLSRGPKPECVKMNSRYSIIQLMTMVEGLAERRMGRP